MSDISRIESLETQVRTLQRMLFGVLGLVVVGGLLAATSMQSVPDVIRAKNFRVVNDAGKVLLELGNQKVDEVDNGMLVARNGEGRELVTLGAGKKGGMVVTKNGRGETLVELGRKSGGFGSVKVENGSGGAVVELSGDNSIGGSVGSMKILNGKGGAIVLVSTDLDGRGLLMTYSHSGRQFLKLSADSGGGYVSTFNGNGMQTSESPSFKERERYRREP